MALKDNPCEEGVNGFIARLSGVVIEGSRAKSRLIVCVYYYCYSVILQAKLDVSWIGSGEWKGGRNPQADQPDILRWA